MLEDFQCDGQDSLLRNGHNSWRQIFPDVYFNGHEGSLGMYDYAREH